MARGQRRDDVCGVCGRPLGDVGVVELQLQDHVLRACAGACRTADGVPLCRAARPRREVRTRIALQLKGLCADIDAANRRGEISFRDALPMRLKLLGEQCELLGITDTSLSTPPLPLPG
jgi:hypothetical protein